jgi:hypothetical protein
MASVIIGFADGVQLLSWFVFNSATVEQRGNCLTNILFFPIFCLLYNQFITKSS